MKLVPKSASCLLLILVAFASHLSAQNASSQIRSEIARLEQSLKANPISDPDVKSLAPMVTDAVKSAADAIDAGRIYLALEKLGQAEDLLEAARVAAEKSEVESGGLPAFESRWGKVSLRLSALEKDAHERDWKSTPLAIRALAEAAQTRAVPLLEGGRGFATANGPKDGLLYIGEAEGEADFSTFCAVLKAEGKRPSFTLRSLLPELHALQEKTNAAFQPPKSIDLHSRFIALNSQIKLADELDASRFYAGALYAYLDAVRHYGMLDAPPLDTAEQEQARRDLTAAKAKLAASSSDDSIAQLFLERAASYAVHSDGSAPSAEEWRGVRVILEQVLPAYSVAQKPPAQMAQTAGKTVDITLVRWPYT